MAETQIALFDYGQLDTETRQIVETRTAEIRDAMKRTAENVVMIGCKLSEVKDRLGHGHFLSWLAAEFDWSQQTANNYMNVAERFKLLNFSNLGVAPSALYALAAPSTPEPARQEAIERATQGEPITYTEAKRIVSKHKEERKQEERKAKQETAAAIESAQAILADPDAQIIVSAGDVWQLGRHVLYCGDTSGEPFRALLSPAALAFADPPYGAGVKGFDDSAFYWEHDYLIEYADVVAVTPGIVSVFEFARKTAMPYKWSLATWITNGTSRGALGFGNWIYTAIFANVSIYKQAQDFSRVTIDLSRLGETAHPTRKPSEYVAWIIGLFTTPGALVISAKRRIDPRPVRQNLTHPAPLPDCELLWNLNTIFTISLP